MRKLILLIAAASMLMPAPPAGSAHFCGADTGTLVTVPLPPNPVDPARTHLYIHDRANNPGQGLIEEDGEGSLIYLENGRRPNEYNSGGVELVPLYLLNATGQYGDAPCGAVCSGPSFCRPAEGADDLIF